MKNKALWLLAGAAGLAIAAYEVFFAPSHVPAGYTSVAIAPGTLVPRAVPAGGQVGFVLPDGGHWSGAARTPSSGSAQVAVPLPSSTRSPLLVSGVASGTGFMLEWTDASGATQVTIATFA